MFVKGHPTQNSYQPVTHVVKQKLIGISTYTSISVSIYIFIDAHTYVTVIKKRKQSERRGAWEQLEERYLGGTGRGRERGKVMKIYFN